MMGRPYPWRGTPRYPAVAITSCASFPGGRGGYSHQPVPPSPRCQVVTHLNTVCRGCSAPGRVTGMRLRTISMRKGLSWLVALLALVPPMTATGESGTVVFVSSFQHSYLTLDHHGEVYTGGSLNGTLTVVESSAGPFVPGSSLTLECLVFSSRSESNFSVVSPCVNTDLDGDQLYWSSVRSQGTIETGGGGEGQSEIRGGTGKYEGVTGTCDYQTQYLANGWAVTLRECAWSQP